MKKYFVLAFAAAMLAFGCTKPTPEAPTPEPVPTPTPEEDKVPVCVSMTRATESAFETGDKVGVYIVNHTAAGAGTLASSGNHVDNLCFTYSGSWTPEYPIYWASTDTDADFYCYYPYTANIADVTKFPFSVNKDQSTESAYMSCDFLLGKSADVTPSSEPVDVMLGHKMSRLVIALVAGNGYTEEELASADVTICSVKADALINLASGEVTASGSVVEVKPYLEDGQYKALLVPQIVSDADFVKITIGERTYVLKQSLTLESGMQHKCTITVAKTGQGVNIGISDWVVDSVDYGGTLE